MTVREVFDAAMELNPEERIALNAVLLESLDPPGPAQGVEDAWKREVERRIAELDSGAVQTVAWGDVKARLLGKSGGSGHP